MSLLSLRRWEGLELSVEEVVVVLGAPLGVVSWDLGWLLPNPTGAPGAELRVGAAVPQLALGACPQLLCTCWGHGAVL